MDTFDDIDVTEDRRPEEKSEEPPVIEDVVEDDDEEGLGEDRASCNINPLLGCLGDMEGDDVDEWCDMDDFGRSSK